jgi:hypothetical protein
MTKKVQSILYFSVFILACLVYTITDNEKTEMKSFSSSNSEIIQNTTVSLNSN